MITDTIANSLGKNDVTMSEKIGKAMMDLRQFMFDYVYASQAKQDEEMKGSKVIEQMFYHFTKNPDLLPDEYKQFLEKYPIDRVVCDYIAGMSDDYAVRVFSGIFVPSSWSVF